MSSQFKHETKAIFNINKLKIGRLALTDFLFTSSYSKYTERGRERISQNCFGKKTIMP